jgi:hypothetical protein
MMVMSRNILFLWLTCTCSVTVSAFSPLPFSSSVKSTRLFEAQEGELLSADLSDKVKKAAASYKEEEEAPRMNPNRPELPQLKGDFDWDAKFGTDDDWISGPSVPGRAVLNDLELAAQVTALGKLEEKWKKARQQEEYDDARLLGWTTQAETYNGRYAMFFLVVGLLTEYWTGITFPGQVEEMLRVGGVIGFEG